MNMVELLLKYSTLFSIFLLLDTKPIHSPSSASHFSTKSFDFPEKNSVYH